MRVCNQQQQQQQQAPHPPPPPLSWYKPLSCLFRTEFNFLTTFCILKNEWIQKVFCFFSPVVRLFPLDYKAHRFLALQKHLAKLSKARASKDQ